MQGVPKNTGLATAAQLATARRLFAEHVRSCRALGFAPEPFSRILIDVMSSPEGTFDDDAPIAETKIEPSRHYEQYTPPRNQTETA